MRIALVVGLLAAGMVAQERREPVRGSATLDGKPWSGATVRLLSRPMSQDERIGTADEQSAITDDKGRFLVQLLPGRHYTAWAVEELGDGRYRGSFAVERAIAGLPLDLVADKPLVRQRITFQGLDAWRARGKVVARLLSRTDQRFVVEATLTGDEWLLPLIPGRKAVVEITCDGLPLFPWPAAVDLTKQEEPWPVLGPRSVRVKVVDPAGLPVAGAALALCTIDPPEGTREVECALERTDAKGEAVVTLPLGSRDFNWSNYAFSVLAKGFAPVRNIQEVKIKADHEGTKDGPAMVIPLKAGRSHELHLLRGEKPFVASVFSKTPGATVGVNQFTPYGGSQRHIVPDAQGRFQLLRMDDGVAVVLGTVDSLRRPVGLAAPLHPMALLGVIAADEARAEITWDLDTLMPLVLQVVSPDGTPVEAARLAVLADHGKGCKLALSGLCSDRSGRIAALIPADQPVVVAAWTDDGFSLASATAARDGKPIVLKIERVRSLPGRVVGKDGNAVAFAVVECHLYPFAVETVALADAVRLLAVPTDRQGAFRMPLFPGLIYSGMYVKTPDDEHPMPSNWIVGRSEPDELVLDLRKPR